MTWFKIDDSFYDHPKVFDAPDCAVALWTRAGSWSSRNRTGGFVPSRMPARLCDDPDRAVAELVRRGLWSRASGGYRFHDWTDFNPSREEATAAADKMSAAGSLGNHRRWHVKKGRIEPTCQFCTSGTASGTRSGGRYPIGASGQGGPDALPDADPMSDSAPEEPDPTNEEPEPDQDEYRVPDRVPSGVPESPPNPPDPTRSTSGQGGDQPHGSARTREEPPTRCPQHEDDDDPPPCRACKRARETHQQWARDRAADAARRTQAIAHERAEANRIAIAACKLCDDRGYLGAQPCSHDPKQAERARTGAAAARQHLAGLASGDRCPDHPGQPAGNCSRCGEPT